MAAITFRGLLSHRSGIKDYGNNSQDYATLKKFFTQTVDATKNTPCQGAAVTNPANPINTQDFSPCYSNYNFSIFRVLLPMIDGFVDDPANRAAKLAAAYIKIVETNVFEPVGQPAWTRSLQLRDSRRAPTRSRTNIRERRQGTIGAMTAWAWVRRLVSGDRRHRQGAV
ncbi:MAG: hypothetical protein WDO73_36995 [Ignavibacteriota bacterium]